MLLSPLEIQQKQFPIRFRGLDAKEVPAKGC
jgi:DivIVA domain-containing protein